MLGLYLNTFAAEKYMIERFRLHVIHRRKTRRMRYISRETRRQRKSRRQANRSPFVSRLRLHDQRSMVASTSSLVLSLMFALIHETHQTVEQHRLEGEHPSRSASARTTSSIMREGCARALEARVLEARALENGPLDAVLAHDPTPRMCCMAYSIQCLAACAGMAEDNFCQVMFSHPLCATRLFAGRGWPTLEPRAP